VSRSNIATEVVLVDDGSTDRTVKVVEEFCASHPQFAMPSIVKHARNLGKGAAIRTGLAASSGQWRLIMDADNSCRVGEVEHLMAAADRGVGMVAGSRECAGSVVEARWHRKAAGGLFRLVLRSLGLDLLRDTQCGFKLYRGDLAAEVVKYSKEDGFAFDLEHLLIAQASKLRGVEVPVEWRHRDGGTVSPVIDGIRMAGQALRIRRLRSVRTANVAVLPVVYEAPAARAASFVEAKPAGVPAAA
jgi:dolichyl-phosphate beta-glucosyltransferase